MFRTKKSIRLVGAVIIFLVLLLSSFSAGVIFGSYKGYSNGSGGKVVNRDAQPDFLLKDVDFGMYWQLWNIIKDKYLYRDKIVDTKLFYGSLAGMVAALNDPYSVFLDPQVTQEFTEELAGSFEGIGAEIAIKKGRLTVIAPLPNTPAERAGLKAGDKILAIDGVDTLGMSLDQAVSLIRGKQGSEVKLLVQHNSDEPVEISIVRDKIEIISVSWKELEPGVAYIKISYFNEDTDEDFRQTVREVLASKPRALVLDLRNNPGGFLDVAIKLASFWVKDDVVVEEKFW